VHLSVGGEADRTNGSIAAWIEAEGIEPAVFSRDLKAGLSRDAADITVVHRLETGELFVGGPRVARRRTGQVNGRPVDPVGVITRLFAGIRPDPAMFTLAGELRGFAGTTVRSSADGGQWRAPWPTLAQRPEGRCAGRTARFLPVVRWS